MVGKPTPRMPAAASVDFFRKSRLFVLFFMRISD
jgi:hypothetical protein